MPKHQEIKLQKKPSKSIKLIIDLSWDLKIKVRVQEKY